VTTPLPTDGAAVTGFPARGGGPGRALLGVLAALAVAGLLLLGAAAGAVAARGDAPPADTSAAAGFARDMSVHHGQAVEMAMALHSRTDDPRLRALTADTALTQQAQIGRMQAWLEDWGLSPTGTDPAMAWMAQTGGDHAPLSDGRMPGMATPEDVADLSTLPVDAAEVRFLQLMTAHHLAGVEMGEAGVALVEEPDVRALAESIVSGQTSELQVLRDMLAERGATADGSAAGHTGH
jgi:uncharacterized protein (DUF305 family)